MAISTYVGIFWAFSTLLISARHTCTIGDSSTVGTWYTDGSTGVETWSTVIANTVDTGSILYSKCIITLNTWIMNGTVIAVRTTRDTCPIILETVARYTLDASISIGATM